MPRLPIFLALILWLVPVVGHAALPASLSQLLATAIVAEDETTILAVSRTMVKAFPQYKKAVRAALQAAPTPAVDTALAALEDVFAPEATAAASAQRISDAVPPDVSEDADSRGFIGFGGWQGLLRVDGTMDNRREDTRTLDARLNLKRGSRAWQHELRVAFDVRDGVETDRERRFISGYELDYDIDGRSFVSALGEYRSHHFSDVDRRVVGTLGYGRRLIDRRFTQWEIEGGPGVQSSVIDLAGESQTQMIGRVASDLSWNLVDGATLTNDIDVLFGVDSATVETTTALLLDVSKRLQGKLSVETQTRSDMPDQEENTETVTRASLFYRF